MTGLRFVQALVLVGCLGASTCAATRSATSLSATWLGGALWLDAEATYLAAANHYRAAHAQSDQAKHQADNTNNRLLTAIYTYEQAELMYRVAAALVVVSASFDVAARGGGGALSCRTTSTRSFRRHLSANGVSLTGKDIDHIVPRSLGGVDHPLNYQVLNASVNRSLGATWGPGKCLGSGLPACAAAVLVTAVCA